MDKLPKRKDIRLKNYDYSQSGYYFVTICTKNRLGLLSSIVGGDLQTTSIIKLTSIVGGGFHTTPIIKLTPIGKEIIQSIEFISKQNPNIIFDKYIIMPNHIHLIIILQDSEIKEHQNSSLDKIIGRLKSYTNKRYNDINNAKNLILWQRNYYEHIIRNQEEYEDTWQYIETNPMKWEEDKYYI